MRVHKHTYKHDAALYLKANLGRINMNCKKFIFHHFEISTYSDIPWGISKVYVVCDSQLLGRKACLDWLTYSSGSQMHTGYFEYLEVCLLVEFSNLLGKQHSGISFHQAQDKPVNELFIINIFK